VVTLIDGLIDMSANKIKSVLYVEEMANLETIQFQMATLAKNYRIIKIAGTCENLCAGLSQKFSERIN